MNQHTLNSIYFLFNPKITCFIFFVLFSGTMYAQIQVQTTVQAARCSADGQIIVKATGGTPPYSYQLIGTSRPPQTNDTFKLLPPAVYTLRVTDKNGINSTVSVTISGNYQEPSIQCTVSKTTVQLTTTGGRSPYRYAYSPYNSGTFTPPQSSSTFECVPQGNHVFRVYDSCDNFFSIPCTVEYTRLFNTTICKKVNGKTTLTTTAFGGGEPPYTFTCVTSNGDTLRNTTGNFSQLTGCETRLFFADKCNRTFQIFDCDSVVATIKCANFKDRTASLSASGGTPPYRFRSLDATQVNTNGQFSNLPRNADVYNFEVRDSCGRTQVASVSKMSFYDVVGNICPYTGTIFVKIKQGVSEPDTCGKNCSSFYPYQFKCIDCVPRRTFFDYGDVGQSSTIRTVDVTPLPQGTYHFDVFNGCGDSIRIEVITKKTVPPLTVKFECNINRIKATTDLTVTTYILRDSLRRIIATNTTGIFNSPYSGGFYVDAIYADCDTAQRFVTTVIPKTSICFGLGSKLNAAGQCEFKWQLNALAYIASTYQLTGGPNAVNITQPNGNFKDLEPNSTYILKSDCAVDTIKTPPPTLSNLSAKAFTNCAGKSVIQATGGRAIGGCLQTYKDEYLLYDKQNTLIKRNFTGLFDSIKAGDIYQIKLQNPEGCLLQTVTIKAAFYQRPDLIATYGVICGTQTTSNIRAILRGGTPPFTFQITNPLGIRPPIIGTDTAVIFNNLPAGSYVLRASDACGISTDFATSVGTLQFTPTTTRLCDGTLTLEVPAIDSAVYQWKNAANAVIGTNRIVTLKDTIGQTYSVTISTPQPCSFTNSITIPRFSPISLGANAGVDFTSNTFTTALNATPLTQGRTGRWRQILPSTASVVFSNSNSANTGITVSAIPGEYTFVWEVTDNVNGCTATDTVTGIFCNTLSLINATIAITPTACKTPTGKAVITITNASPSTTYLWSNGKTTPSVDNLAAGIYRVTINDIGLCKSTRVDTIRITAPPAIPPRTIDTTLCVGFSLKIGAKTYAISGNYTDTLLSSTGCDSIINSRLTINRLPIETLGIVHDLRAKYCGDSLALNSKGDTSARYQWTWQNVPCTSCPNPKILPLSTPIYYVTITDRITRCTAKDSINVQIEGSFSERIPNAFSPNQDDINDVFNVVPDNCIKIVRRLRIFSRWGNLIFDKPDLSPQKKEGWDGSINDTTLGADVYLFVMEIEFVDGTVKKVSGEVNLIH